MGEQIGLQSPSRSRRSRLSCPGSPLTSPRRHSSPTSHSETVYNDRYIPSRLNSNFEDAFEHVHKPGALDFTEDSAGADRNRRNSGDNTTTQSGKSAKKMHCDASSHGMFDLCLVCACWKIGRAHVGT